MGRLKLFLPLIIFVPLALLLVKSLSLDPQELPSALVNKPVPAFSLPSLMDPGKTLTQADLKGRKALLNVWGSWCPSCRIEHPWLMTLAKEQGIPVIGLNYKDERDDAIAWLERYKDPYVFIIHDLQGTLGLDLGVYGAPETFLIDSDGVIRYKHVGVVDRRVWEQDLLPVWEAMN